MEVEEEIMEIDIIIKIVLIPVGIILICKIMDVVLQDRLEKIEYYIKILKRMEDYNYLARRELEKNKWVEYYKYRYKYKRIKRLFERVTKEKYMPEKDK